MAGAHGLFSGTLYSTSTRGDLFTYPPFAALVFVPLAWLPSTTAAQVVWALLNEAALLALLTIAIRAVRPDLRRRSRRLWAFGLAAPALFLDPVLLAVRHGQVDILITVLVLWDLAGPRRLAALTVPQGVATGLAAAVKLTPLIFVPYLLLTRRGQAAWRCLGTFAVAEAVAFAISPGASMTYWTRDLFDYKRVGGSLGLQGLFAPTDQSLLATLARIDHGTVSPGLQWTLAGVLGVLGVALASVRPLPLVALPRRRVVRDLGPAGLPGHLDAPHDLGPPCRRLAWCRTRSAELGARGGGVHDGALLGLANLVGGRRGERTPA